MQKEVILVMLYEYVRKLSTMCGGKLKLLNLRVGIFFVSNLIRAVYYLTITKEEHIGKKTIIREVK